MLILASQSPRRAALLRAAAIDFEIRVQSIDETPLVAEDARAYVQRLARAKAEAVAAHPDSAGHIVLGADTTVVVDGHLLGKPVDAPDAGRMLRALSGRAHEVCTGVALVGRHGATVAVERTRVWFRVLTPEDIAAYVVTGDPMDKAGAYAIQGPASRFVDRLDGSYTNVVGLPVALVYRLLLQYPEGRGAVRSAP